MNVSEAQARAEAAEAALRDGVIRRLQQQVDELEKEVEWAASMIESLARRNQDYLRENLQLSAEVERRHHGEAP